MSVTVRDIAKKCQVSPGTVSRVLNNRENVKDETRQRVLRAVRELNYDPMDTAPAVQKISFVTYGLVIPAHNMKAISSYYGRAVSAFCVSLHKNDIRCVLLNEDRLVKIVLEEERNPRTALGVDKLILMGIEQPLCDRLLKKLREWRIPAVLVRRKTTLPGVPMIGDDDAKGVRAVCDHLLGLGHSRIAFLNERAPYLEKRLSAFCEALRQQGVEPDPKRVVNRGETDSDFENWVKQCLEEPGVTAFLCGSDDLAVYLLRYLRKMGVSVPDDVSVACIDGGHVTGIYAPSITTVLVPLEKMVDLAVVMLNGSDAWNEDEVYEIEVPNRLIVRESTGSAS